MPRASRPADSRPAGTRSPRSLPAAEPARAHSGASLARRLRLQQLVIFEAVVKAGTLLAASRELAMTQPAVSKALHELEQQLGDALFLRGKRGVTLTAFGERFAPHARTMLADLRYLAEDLNAVRSGTRGQIVVGTLISASSTLVPRAIELLRAAAPDIAVTVRVGSNAVLFPALARGEIDLVVGIIPDSTPVLAGPDARGQQALKPLLKHEALYDEALAIVVGPTHALARQHRQLTAARLRKVALATLVDGDWILPTPDSVAYAQARAFFSRHQLPFPVAPVESISVLTNLALLDNPRAVAMMACSVAERFERAGLLVVLALGGFEPFGKVGYTLRADREPTPATARFIASLVEAERPNGVGAGRRHRPRVVPAR